MSLVLCCTTLHCCCVNHSHGYQPPYFTWRFSRPSINARLCMIIISSLLDSIKILYTTTNDKWGVSRGLDVGLTVKKKKVALSDDVPRSLSNKMCCAGNTANNCHSIATGVANGNTRSPLQLHDTHTQRNTILNMFEAFLYRQHGSHFPPLDPACISLSWYLPQTQPFAID